MATHAYGDAIPLSGFAISRVADIHNVITEVPYVGTIHLLLLPPGATTYTDHALTTGSDGAWSYVVQETEPGYASDRWAYREEIDSTISGASRDKYFDVLPSFVQTHTVTP